MQQLVEIDISHDAHPNSTLAEQMVVDGWRFMCGMFTADESYTPEFMYEIVNRYAEMNMTGVFDALLVYLHEQIEMAGDIVSVVGASIPLQKED